MQMTSYFIDLIRDAHLEYAPIYFLLGSGALAWTLILGAAIKLWIDTIQRNRLIGLIAEHRLSELTAAELKTARRQWPREVGRIEDELAAVRNGLARAVYRDAGQDAEMATKQLP